jgi:hypothetical protein
MLMVRTGGEKSGRSSASLLNWKFALVESWTPPPTRDRRQARDGSHRHTAATVPLKAIVHANEGRAGSPVAFGEIDDRFGGNSCDRGDSFRRILRSATPQRLLTQGVAQEKVAIL